MTTRPLMILGAGRIARALLRQLLAREDYLRERYNLALPVAAVASSRYLAAGAPYLGAGDLAHIADAGLESGEAAPPNRRAQQMGYLTDLARSSPHRAIVVDLTASDGMAPVLLAALDAGVDVALANKKPLSEDYDTFARLTAHRRGHIAYEATVGAGLPIIHTLRALVDAGDELVDMTACLSGTLGYLCTELEDGRPLSQVVPEARARGFTEPDPRDDLSGADVRRKALILARTMNQHLELDDVPGAPMIALEEGDVEGWLAGLARHDVALAARVRSAREQGDVLRYVARILPGQCEVGLRAVPRLSAVGRLRGTDNILTMHTRFYGERPLVISGPGAGPDVTAAGIVGDLLRLAFIA
ncbi:MAG TPA: homoserine dehydrogenase [Chloroflexota bacterium]|nr:homoserine dehydrogenase [Chloroflexota bacterium]